MPVSKLFFLTVNCLGWINFIYSVAMAQSDSGVGQPPIRIYIGNDDHTDFMWTANQSVYENTFVDMLDFHLNLADQTDGNAAEYRNRFNADGSHWLWAYQQKKSAAQFDRLIARIKDGTISAPLNAVVSCYGGQPVEAILRGMYYPGYLERQYDLRFRLAVAMENQGLPRGLPSLFAGSGAQYSWRGVCGCATRMNITSLNRRPREIYWWTGPDGQRLLLKWHSLATGGNQQSGGYSEAFNPVAAIQFLDSDPAFLRRYRIPGASEPYNVRAAFGFGWDALNRKTGQDYTPDPQTYPRTDHFHEIAERESNAQRQVIVSNEQDFFHDFESQYGSTLTSRSETYGNEWDLYSASMSETSARVRRAVEKLRSADLMSVLVSLKQPGFLDQHKAARDLAYRNLGLYWEHNWTADGPITRDQRAAWQQKLAEEIEDYVYTLNDSALTELGALIPRPINAFRFFVLNPLGWTRTEAADIGYAGDTNVHVEEVSSGREVAHQIMQKNGAQYLRILAPDVPANGYKAFEVVSGPAINRANAANVSGTDSLSLDNVAIRLTVQPDGAISSLIDKRNGRVELASTINGLRINDIAAGSDQGDALVVENAGPVSVTIRADSGAGINHTTAITVFRSSSRVDIENQIQANFGDTRYWGFSFGLKTPAIYSEEVGSINLNKLKSAGGSYANTHARYDHITVNHFADINDGSGAKGVTISNADLAFAKLGNSTITKLDVTTPQINMLAGGQVDGPNLGIPSQYGCNFFLQRFSLRPHVTYDQTAAMKFALEHQNPLVTGWVNPAAVATYPEDSFSLASVSNPDVVMWALKVHDDGIQKGLIARLWNMSNVAATASLEFASPVSESQRTTHIETDLAPTISSGNPVSTFFAPQQLQTYRVKLGN
jgi:alpha-mannosidase